VTAALSQLYPAAVQAEALFGKEAKGRIDNLYSSAEKLWKAIHRFHEYTTSKKEEIFYPDDSVHKTKNVIYGVHPGMAANKEQKSSFDDGGFQENLDAAVLGIIEYFSKYIHK
jgi:hypothetical protein